MSRRWEDHTEPEAPGPPRAKTVIGVVVSVVGVGLLVGFVQPGPEAIGVLTILVGVALLLG